MEYARKLNTEQKKQGITETPNYIFSRLSLNFFSNEHILPSNP